MSITEIIVSAEASDLKQKNCLLFACCYVTQLCPQKIVKNL